MALESAAVQASPREVLGNLVGQFIAGSRIDPAAIRDAARQVLSGLGIPFVPVEDLEGGLRRVAERRRATSTAAPPPPPPDPRAAEQARLVREAYQVMGFDLRAQLTEDEIKTRRRQLARQHHPDRGGDVATAQRINAAADILLAHVAARGVRSEAHGR
jgi:hypothetical protein